MNYATETRSAYRSSARAEAYKRRQTQGISWMRLTTWLEGRAVNRALRSYAWSAADRVIDVPCGTGIMGGVLGRFPFRVAAADIATEMMALGRGEYGARSLMGFLQADITNLPFAAGSCRGAVVVGLMHRLPADLRRHVLAELATVVSRTLIVSYNLDGIGQRFKRSLLRIARRGYRPPPAPAGRRQVIGELIKAGFVVRKRTRLVPFLSGEVVLVAEKNAARATSMAGPA